MGNIRKSNVDIKSASELLNKIGNVMYKAIMSADQTLYAIELKVLEDMGVKENNTVAVQPIVTPVEVPANAPLVQANPTNPLVAAMSAVNGADVTAPTVVTPTPAVSNTVPLQTGENDLAVENAINNQISEINNVVTPAVDTPVVVEKSVETPAPVVEPTLPNNEPLIQPSVEATVQPVEAEKAVEIPAPVVKPTLPNNKPLIQPSVEVTVQPVEAEKAVETPTPVVEPILPSNEPLVQTSVGEAVQPVLKASVDPFVEANAEIEKFRTELNNKTDQVSEYLKQLREEINKSLDLVARRTEAQRQTFNSAFNLNDNEVNMNNSSTLTK